MSTTARAERMASGRNGLSSPGSAPVEVGTLDTPGDAYALAVSGSFVLVADGYGGLRVVGVSVPAWPVEVGGALTLGLAANLAVSGGTVYVAGQWAGMSVFRERSSLLLLTTSSPADPSRWSAVVGGTR